MLGRGSRPGAAAGGLGSPGAVLRGTARRKPLAGLDPSHSGMACVPRPLSFGRGEVNLAYFEAFRF